MKHWYRYEVEPFEEKRRDDLCKFLRRSHMQFESGGGDRKLFRKHSLCNGSVLYVVAFLDDEELAAVNHWLQTH